MWYYIFPVLGTEKTLPIYVYGIGQNDLEGHIKRENGYPYHQILYSTRGKGRLLVSGREYTIGPNMAFYLPANMPHEYYAIAEEWDTHWIVVGGFAVGETLASFGLTEAGVYELGSISRLDMLFRSTYNAIVGDKLFGNYSGSGMAYSFLIEFYRQISDRFSGCGEPGNNIMARVTEYVESNFKSEITLDDLCEVAGVSRQHICRLFKKCLGVRPMEYITKVRLREAKNLLLTTQMSISEVGEAVGFRDSSYFGQQFKRYELTSPAEYRRMTG